MTWANQLDPFLEEVKQDILSARYFLNDELLDKSKPLAVNNAMIHSQARERESAVEPAAGALYKLIHLRMDLCCYFAKSAALSAALELAFTDFERTFFSRAESGREGEFLAKRVYVSHNGVKYSIYFAEESKFRVR